MEMTLIFMVVLYLTFLLVMTIYTLGLLSVVSKTRNPNFYNSLHPGTLTTHTYYLNSNFTTLVLEDTSNILRRSSPIISTVDMSHKFVYANMHVNCK